MIRLLALSATLLFGSAAFAQDAHDHAATETPATEIDHVFTEAPGERVLGADDAPHTLIVYASNMCPHCGSWFANDWPGVKSELIEPGTLRVVFRPLPSPPHQLSMIGFVMAECAPDADYFKVIEDQFARQATILEKMQAGGLREEYEAIGQVAGLEDDDARNACLTNTEKLAPIHRAGERATAAGISTIPAFILDGKLVKIDGSVKAITAALDAEG